MDEATLNDIIREFEQIVSFYKESSKFKYEFATDSQSVIVELSLN